MVIHKKDFFGVLVSAAIALETVPAYFATADDTHTVMKIGEDGFDRGTAEKLYIDQLFGIDTAMPYANHGSELLTGAAE